MTGIATKGDILNAPEHEAQSNGTGSTNGNGNQLDHITVVQKPFVLEMAERLNVIPPEERPQLERQIEADFEAFISRKFRGDDIDPLREVFSPYDGGETCTDSGNAQRLARYFVPYLRWVSKVGYMVWDGRRWVSDSNEILVQEMAKATARAIYVEASKCEDESRRIELSKWAVKSESGHMIREMVKLAKGEPNIQAKVSDLDRDPLLFNCLNGTLDLSTCELHPHNPMHLITKLTSVEYRPEAQCPLWKKFTSEIFDEDEAITNYVQRYAGLCLTGITNQREFIFAYGGGSNGKSTLLSMLRAVLGDYAQTASFTTFLQSKDRANSARDDLVDQKGARMICAIEANEGQRIDEGLLKQLVGGEDEIKARHMYMQAIEFKPTAKIWLAANAKPVIRDTTDSIWDRLRLVHFKVRFGDLATDPKAKKQKDYTLAAKLDTERSGILNWLVAGYKDFVTLGSLQAPPQVLAATKEYRTEQDIVQLFLDACCECDPERHTKNHVDIITGGYYVLTSALYQSFIAWCSEEGVTGKRDKPMTKANLVKRLSEKEFISHNVTGNKAAWWGLRLLPADDEG